MKLRDKEKGRCANEDKDDEGRESEREKEREEKGWNDGRDHRGRGALQALVARETGHSRSFETSTFSIPWATLAARTPREEIRNSWKIANPRFWIWTLTHPMRIIVLHLFFFTSSSLFYSRWTKGWIVVVAWITVRIGNSVGCVNISFPRLASSILL